MSTGRPSTDEFDAVLRCSLERTELLEIKSEVSAIAHPYARVSGTDLEGRIDFIEPEAERAGAGRITLSVKGRDALLELLTARRIEHEAIETHSNGVRHVKIRDPDGNAIAFAEPADAA